MGFSQPAGCCSVDLKAEGGLEVSSALGRIKAPPQSFLDVYTPHCPYRKGTPSRHPATEDHSRSLGYLDSLPLTHRQVPSSWEYAGPSLFQTLGSAPVPHPFPVVFSGVTAQLLLIAPTDFSVPSAVCRQLLLPPPRPSPETPKRSSTSETQAGS